MSRIIYEKKLQEELKLQQFLVWAMLETKVAVFVQRYYLNIKKSLVELHQ